MPRGVGGQLKCGGSKISYIRSKFLYIPPRKPPSKPPGSQYLLQSSKLLHAEWQCSDNTLFGRLLAAKQHKGFPFLEAMPLCHSKSELCALPILNTFCCFKLVFHVATSNI